MGRVLNGRDSRPRIGLLGGTFDPPHLGHLVLAETAIGELGLEKVLFLPVGRPTHKESQTPTAQRIAMTRLAVAGRPEFEIDLTDVERPPPHFTVDLLPLLQRRWPNADLWLLIGGDSLRDLPSWHRPQELITRCRLAVLDRPGATFDWVELARPLPGLWRQVTVLRGPAVFVSSTDLRRRVAAGKPAGSLLPAPVEDYISREKLYKAERDDLLTCG